MFSQKLAEAVEFLKAGEIGIAPTETVYGLFGDANNDSAIKKIYEAKGRPSFNPLISHVSSIGMAEKLAEFNETAMILANYFWLDKAQPLTLILKKRRGAELSSLLTAGLDTVAIRIPMHSIAIELIDKFGGALAAPSANKSMSISPTTINMALSDLADAVSFALDGGACNVGLESTIVDVSSGGIRILRPGYVSQESIEDVLKESVPPCQHTGIIAPGMMKRHYSPKLPLRLCAHEPYPGEAFIAFGKTDVSPDANLSESGALEEASRSLYKTLKELDVPEKFKGIAIMPIPNVGIGVAINDRLTRAAARDTAK